MQRSLLIGLFLLLASTTLNAQISGNGSQVIHTAVPFLSISPDARAGGMGDLGVATAPDAVSMHWNPAKYAMTEDLWGVSFSYVPWLSKITDNMGMGYLTGYYHPDDVQTFASSIRFFSWGEIYFHTMDGAANGGATPFELALDFAYARKLGEHLSGAVSFRYIYSKLFNGIESKEAGNAVAADLSFFYERPIYLSRTQSIWRWGVNLSNIGTKMSYNGGSHQEFIPANLRLGTSLDFLLNTVHKLTWAVELNKLLVPSGGQEYREDSEGQVIVQTNHSDKSVFSSMFSSLSDAQGGFSEEFKEISWATGLAYQPHKSISARLGYFYEHQDKGNRQYFTLGMGAILKEELALDFSYLIPTENESPLGNTLHVSLSIGVK